MRVLVTSVGSSPGVDLCRCLAADPSLTIVGADASADGRRFGQRLCAEVVALPRADAGADAYVAALRAVASDRGIDFVFSALDVEVGAVLSAATPLTVAHALPNAAAAPLLDKAALVQHAPVQLVPRSAAVAGEVGRAGLAQALDAVGTPAWLRPAVGTSGRASLAVQGVDDALAWLSLWRARGQVGRWLLQEFLPGDNLNWTGVYVDGECVAAAAMQRTAYYLHTVAPSGVTGQVREAITVDRPEVAEVARALVGALTPRPHGVWSVDLRLDREGTPKVTEVNPRFAGRPTLSARAACNLPLAALRGLTGQPLGDAVTRPGGRPGVRMVRQLDLEPLFVE